ncbi:MAG: nucleotidyltransferase family protein [Hyphomicrobiaceae bacterium]
MRSDAPLLVTETLLRGVVEGRLPEVAPVALDEEVWLETIRLASAHLVLPALAAALDLAGPGWPIGDEARAYLDTIRAGNAARNGRLKGALVEIVGKLQWAGLDPIVVKGGAWLIEADDAAPWRFMGDLDLIVGEGQLADAVSALTSAGFTPSGDDYDPSRDAHAPAMLAPDGETIVELHNRAFADLACPALEAALAEHPHGLERDGVVLRRPSPEARLAYLLLHSQEHHAYHAQRRLLLRDQLEIGMLTKRHRLDLAAALALVPEVSRPRAGALLAAAENFGVAMPGIIFASSQRQWADRARRRLMHRVFHRQLTGALDMAGHEARRLVLDPKRTIRLVRGLAAPGQMRRKILKKIAKFRDRAAG